MASNTSNIDSVSTMFDYYAMNPTNATATSSTSSTNSVGTTQSINNLDQWNSWCLENLSDSDVTSVKNDAHCDRKESKSSISTAAIHSAASTTLQSLNRGKEAAAVTTVTRAVAKKIDRKPPIAGRSSILKKEMVATLIEEAIKQAHIKENIETSLKTRIAILNNPTSVPSQKLNEIFCEIAILLNNKQSYFASKKYFFELKSALSTPFFQDNQDAQTVLNRINRYLIRSLSSDMSMIVKYQGKKSTEKLVTKAEELLSMIENLIQDTKEGWQRHDKDNFIVLKIALNKPPFVNLPKAESIIKLINSL